MTDTYFRGIEQFDRGSLQGPAHVTFSMFLFGSLSGWFGVYALFIRSVGYVWNRSDPCTYLDNKGVSF